MEDPDKETYCKLIEKSVDEYVDKDAMASFKP